MPGFRYCSWCNGKGCMCCEAEQAKFASKAKANAPSWRPADIRDVRDAAVLAEVERAIHGLDALTEDEVEEAFKPALDAEYERQFPDGPQPLLTVSRSDPDSMAILAHAFHVDVLTKAFSDGGGGMAEIERLAAEARAMQAQAAANEAKRTT